MDKTTGTASYAAGTAQPFEPTDNQLLQMPLFTGGNIPRYLFRLHSHQTAGSTNEVRVKPPSRNLTKSQTVDIFSLAPETAAAHLNEHLRWWGFHEKNCNLMSWTSSLLFALQYGMYRHHHPDDRSKLDNIYLLILDTKKLDSRLFVKDVEIIRVFTPDYPASARERNTLCALRRLRDRDDYCFGEYLTQGYLSIEGHCVQVSMQRMVDLGLFDILPELGNIEVTNKWADKVRNIRRPISWGEECFVTKREVRKAITLAQGSFGERWAVPFGLMLLGFKRRKNEDPMVVQTFLALFDTTELEDSLLDVKIDSNSLPEVQQFEKMVHAIKRRIHSGGDVESLVSGLDNLRWARRN